MKKKIDCALPLVLCRNWEWEMLGCLYDLVKGMDTLIGMLNEQKKEHSRRFHFLVTFF